MRPDETSRRNGGVESVVRRSPPLQTSRRARPRADTASRRCAAPERSYYEIYDIPIYVAHEYSVSNGRAVLTSARAALALRSQRCAHCGNVSPRPPRGRGPTRERAAWELRGRCHLPDAQTVWFSTLLWSPASLHTEFSDALVLGALRPHRCGLGPLGRPTRCPRWPSVGGACKLAGAWLRSPRGHPR